MNLHKLLFPEKHSKLLRISTLLTNADIREDEMRIEITQIKSELKSMLADVHSKETEINSLKKQIELTPTRESILAEFAEANKPKWRENCVFAFHKDGHDYHKFQSSSDLPLNRYKVLNEYLIELANGLTQDELQNLVSIAEDGLSEALASINQKKKVTSLTYAVAAMQEIKSRNSIIPFHPHILTRIAALITLRDDEDPTVINDQINKEKCELFHQWGGDADFFTKLGLTAFIPNVEQFLGKWKELWELSTKVVTRSRETFDKIAGEIRS